MTTTDFPQVSDSAQGVPHTPHTPAHTPPAQEGQPAVPPLTTPLKAFLGLLAGASAALGTMAFVGMFSAVRTAMVPYFHGDAWMIPVGTDLGIILLSGFAVFLELASMPLWWLRGAILSLLGLQLGLNIGAADGHKLGMVGHAVLPVLFIATVEVWIYIVRKRRGLIGQKKKRDRIPAARYFHDWKGSREIRGAMILWGTNSYSEALAMLQARKLAETSLTIMFPHGDAPKDLVLKLTLPAYLSDAVAEITRMRRQFDKGVTPKSGFEQHLANIVNPGQPGGRDGEDSAGGQAPGCCDAHRALALSRVLPLQSPAGDGAADPIGNAVAVNDGHIAAHGSAIGADNLRLLFKIGTAPARRLRDDLKTRRQSGPRSGAESGRTPGAEPAAESGQDRAASRGGHELAGVGSGNGRPTEGGDAR